MLALCYFSGMYEIDKAQTTSHSAQYY